MCKEIKRLVVETTSLCNLQCKRCLKQNPTGGCFVPEGTLKKEIFLKLEPVFGNLDSLVLNGIGEPLLNPYLAEFIGIAAKKMPNSAQLGFQTNGTLFDERNSQEILEAGANTVCISVDSVRSKGYDEARGANLALLQKSFSLLNSARANLGLDDVRLGVETVLTKNNVMELPDIASWAIDNGVSFILVSQLMPYQKENAADVAYDTNTQSAIAIYKKWMEIAKNQNIDFSRYYAAFMKFDVRINKNDARLLELANKMIADADKQGIYLHLENLLKRDEAFFARIEDVFAQTADLCKKNGVLLDLPETAPRNERRCEFVEDNSLFISFDGSVHPCYFLWHRFNCYIGAVEKRVSPWVLGSLEENELLEIWNSPDYKKFRDSVLQYDFPFCFDCSFALCDYVYVDDFKEDCYLVDVPCAACLWCTGLFKCLF